MSREVISVPKAARASSAVRCTACLLRKGFFEYPLTVETMGLVLLCLGPNLHKQSMTLLTMNL